MAIRGYALAIGAEPTQLVSVIPPVYKQLDIQASPDNVDNVYLLGPGPGAWGVLLPGKSWGSRANEGEQLEIGGDLYISGTEGEYAYILVVV